MTTATYDYNVATEQGLASGYSVNAQDKKLSIQEVPSVFNPALGLIMSSQDAIRLLSMFLSAGNYNGTQILSKISLETMWTSVGLGDEGFAGLGFRLRQVGNQRVIGSIGGFSDSAAFIDFLPDANIGVLTLANANVNMDRSAHFQIAGSVSMALGFLSGEKFFQSIFKEPTIRQVDEKVLENYTGTFSSALGNIEMIVKDGKLTGTLLDTKLTLVPTNVAPWGFFIESDFEAINGLFLGMYRDQGNSYDIMIIEDRQFAYRVN
jgi:Beta-lactamase